MSLVVNLMRHAISSLAYGEYGMKCSKSYSGNYVNVYLPQVNASGPYMSNVDLEVLRTSEWSCDNRSLAHQVSNPFEVLPLAGKYNESTHVYTVDLDLDDAVLCGECSIRKGFLKFLRSLDYTRCSFVLGIIITRSEGKYTLSIVNKKGLTSVALSVFPVTLVHVDIGRSHAHNLMGKLGYNVGVEKTKTGKDLSYGQIESDRFGPISMKLLLEYERDGVKIKEVTQIYRDINEMIDRDMLDNADRAQKVRIKTVRKAVHDFVREEDDITQLISVVLVKMVDEQYAVVITHQLKRNGELGRYYRVVPVDFN